jgi:hypothetical protein
MPLLFAHVYDALHTRKKHVHTSALPIESQREAGNAVMCACVCVCVCVCARSHVHVCSCRCSYIDTHTLTGTHTHTHTYHRQQQQTDGQTRKKTDWKTDKRHTYRASSSWGAPCGAFNRQPHTCAHTVTHAHAQICTHTREQGISTLTGWGWRRVGLRRGDEFLFGECSFGDCLPLASPLSGDFARSDSRRNLAARAHCGHLRDLVCIFWCL